MNSDWSGAFLPLFKHRDYCGDIRNHIEVVSIMPLSDVDDEEYNDSLDHEVTVEELSEIGDGETAWLVTVGFVQSAERYDYIVWADEGDVESIADALAAELA